MKPPFTSEQFLEVFKQYNEAVFPMHILFYLLGFIIIYFTIKPIQKSNRFINLIMAFFWLWMGIVYHIIFFTTINKAAYIFGGLFIIQGLIFFVFGVFKDEFLYELKYNIYGIVGMILIAFALIVYPILGYFIGHVYPNSPTFGLPCPTTIFTFGILLLNRKRCPIWILMIPFLWSIIGFTAVIQFGILEDSSLIVASLISISLLVYRNKILLKN